MSGWRTEKGKYVLKVLIKLGWSIKRQKGSHLIISKPTYSDYVWAFRDSEEIGPKMLSRIAKKTGLMPSDL